MLFYPVALFLAGLVYFGARLAADVMLDALFPWCDHPSECFDYAFELGSTVDARKEPCDSLYDHTCAFWNENHPGFENQFALVAKKLRVQMYRHLEAAPARQSPTSIRDKTVAAFRKCQEVFADRSEHVQVILDVFKGLSYEWPSLDLSPDFDVLDALMGLSLDHGLGYVFITEPAPYLKTDSRYALAIGTRTSPFEGSAGNAFVIRNCVEAAMPNDADVSQITRRIVSAITDIVAHRIVAGTALGHSSLYVSLRYVGNLTNPSVNASHWVRAINNHLDADRQVGLDEEVMLVDASFPLILKDALRGASSTVDLMLAVGWAVVHKLAVGTSYSQIDCVPISDVFSTSEGCLGLVNDLVPFPLARFLFDAVQPAEVVNTTSDMMVDVQEATMKSFETTTWMDPYTAQGARERVETIVDVVNLPDRLSRWEDLEAAYDFVAPFNGTSFVEDYLETRRRLLRARKRLLVNGSGAPIRREEIPLSMIETNAYYAPILHMMVIPGGLLFPPFVVGPAPAAVNYGGIGRVLGHELTHAFDRQFGHLSRTGEVRDWYSNHSRRAFEDKLQCVAEKVFNATGSRDWARSSLPEAFADTAGVEKAYLVYRQRSEASSGAGMLGYTGEQLFFLSGCFIFCGRERLASTVTRAYPPLFLRCDLPAANLNRFADAFGCRPDAQLNPSTRCDFH